MTMGTHADIVQNLADWIWRNSTAFRAVLLNGVKKPRHLSLFIEEKDDGTMLLQLSRWRYYKNLWKLELRIDEPEKIFCTGDFTVCRNYRHYLRSRGKPEELR